MKMHFHPSFSYFYVPRTEGIKIINIYDDLDEAFVNYNITCNKKGKSFVLVDTDFTLEENSELSVNNSSAQNFYDQVF